MPIFVLLNDFVYEIMKKILEVLQYGDFDIRFKTDLDPIKFPETIAALPPAVAFSMATKLWGGNENAVLSVIRALAVADLSLCFNRKQMLKFLEEDSAFLAMSMKEAQKEFERNGGKVKTFAPGVPRPNFTPKSK